MVNRVRPPLVHMCLVTWEAANSSDSSIYCSIISNSQMIMNYIHYPATYSIKVRLYMSCTIVNSNANVNTENDMKECTEVNLCICRIKATVCYIWISAYVNKTTSLRTNKTGSSNHTKHASRHSISNDCQIIQNNIRVYNSH